MKHKYPFYATKVHKKNEIQEKQEVNIQQKKIPLETAGF